ncbi:unnamed protein product [Phaeothamnion confervicola]
MGAPKLARRARRALAVALVGGDGSGGGDGDGSDGGGERLGLSCSWEAAAQSVLSIGVTHCNQMAHKAERDVEAKEASMYSAPSSSPGLVAGLAGSSAIADVPATEEAALRAAVASLPAEWTVVGLCLSPTGHLVLTRLAACAAPLTAAAALPPAVAAGPLTEWASLMEANCESLRGPKTPADIAAADTAAATVASAAAAGVWEKRRWWRRRGELDAAVERLLAETEADWLRATGLAPLLGGAVADERLARCLDAAASTVVASSCLGGAGGAAEAGKGGMAASAAAMAAAGAMAADADDSDHGEDADPPAGKASRRGRGAVSAKAGVAAKKKSAAVAKKDSVPGAPTAPSAAPMPAPSEPLVSVSAGAEYLGLCVRSGMPMTDTEWMAAAARSLAAAAATGGVVGALINPEASTIAALAAAASSAAATAAVTVAATAIASPSQPARTSLTGKERPAYVEAARSARMPRRGGGDSVTTAVATAAPRPRGRNGSSSCRTDAEKRTVAGPYQRPPGTAAAAVASETMTAVCREDSDRQRAALAAIPGMKVVDLRRALSERGIADLRGKKDDLAARLRQDIEAELHHSSSGGGDGGSDARSENGGDESGGSESGEGADCCDVRLLGAERGPAAAAAEISVAAAAAPHANNGSGGGTGGGGGGDGGDTESGSGLPSPLRHPVILVLDERLQAIPWECMPCLLGHPVTRVPALAHVYRALDIPWLLASNPAVDAGESAACDGGGGGGSSNGGVGGSSSSGGGGRCVTRPSSGGSPGRSGASGTTAGVAIHRALPPRISLRSAFYVLDPEANLARTRESLAPTLRNYERLLGWTGTVATGPEAAALAAALSETGLFVYCGHGAGETLLGRAAVEELPACAAAVLMGCSSGRLSNGSGSGSGITSGGASAGHGGSIGTVSGGRSRADGAGSSEPSAGASNDGVSEMEPMGMASAYLAAGSVAVVANLWDVTDRDIDRFSVDLLDRFVGPAATTSAAAFRRGGGVAVEGGAAGGGGSSIAHAVAAARRQCKLRYIVGAAPVVYGVPALPEWPSVSYHSPRHGGRGGSSDPGASFSGDGSGGNVGGSGGTVGGDGGGGGGGDGSRGTGHGTAAAMRRR